MTPVHPCLAHIYYGFGCLRQKCRTSGVVTRESPICTPAMCRIPQYSCQLDPLIRPCSVLLWHGLNTQSKAFCMVFILRIEGWRCWLSHEGVACWRTIREAWKGSSCFLDAAGHSQGVSAQRGGHGQVGELGVKVPEVCGARLWVKKERNIN